MQKLEAWNEVLFLSKEISKINDDVIILTSRLCSVLREAELCFGLESDEMNNVFESLLDFRHSSLDDLVSFIDIVAERENFASEQMLQ